jgi:hypothetical protein
LVFSASAPQGPDQNAWRSCGQSTVKRFTPHAEAAPRRQRSGDTSPTFGFILADGSLMRIGR